MRFPVSYSRLLLYDALALLGVIAWLGASGRLPIMYFHFAGGLLLLLLGLHTAQVAFEANNVWKALALSPVFACGWYVIFLMAYRLLTNLWPEMSVVG